MEGWDVESMGFCVGNVCGCVWWSRELWLERWDSVMPFNVLRCDWLLGNVLCIECSKWQRVASVCVDVILDEMVGYKAVVVQINVCMVCININYLLIVRRKTGGC